MRILIISDLHIGPTARCEELVPADERSGSEINNEYIKHFASFVGSLPSPLDYIIVCGDITDSATPEQFAHFDIIINKLLDVTGLDTDKVFVTAGNHDYDRTHLPDNDVAIDDDVWEERYAPLKGSVCLSAILANSNGRLTESPYYCRWQDDNVYVVSINTAAYEKPSDMVKSGYISEEMLEGISAQVNGDNIKDINKVKILLMHHHPINYPNLISDWKDFSILQCHQDIVRFACGHGFDFIIHGHRHQPKFESKLSADGDQITIIASGSFSHQFPYSAYDLVSNQLHVLEVDSRDAESGVMKGAVCNYAFTHTKGWKESKRDGDGIEHKISFGPNEHKTKLYDVAKPYIEESIAAKGHCRVRDLITDNFVFHYKNDDVIYDVVTRICHEIDCESFGDNIRDTVILKSENA